MALGTKFKIIVKEVRCILETNTSYITIDGTDMNDAYRQNIREKTIIAATKTARNFFMKKPPIVFYRIAVLIPLLYSFRYRLQEKNGNDTEG